MGKLIYPTRLRFPNQPGSVLPATSSSNARATAPTPDLPTADTLASLRAGILALFETFEQHPTVDELERAVSRAVVRSSSTADLTELVSRGRIAEVAEVRPIKLEMDLLNKCNLRCVMCMMSHESHYRQPLKRMPLDVFERLAADIFWHVKALSFTLGAEPLLHPLFPRFLQIASSYRIPEIYAVTNGTLLSADIARAMVTGGMHTLTVSIDAACPATYRKIRVGGDWDCLMRNLQTLQRIKRELGAQRPHLELTFVLMRSNIEELPAFVEMAAALGARSVNTIHMVPFKSLNIVHESLSLDREMSNTMLRRARDRAAALGLLFSGPALFAEAKAESVAAPRTTRFSLRKLIRRVREQAGLRPRARPSSAEVVATSAAAQSAERFNLPTDPAMRAANHCPFPWHFAAIDMHGDVVPCGWWHGQPGMGNIYSESFLSIWQNESYRTLRREHITGALRPTCRTCPAAGTGSVDGDSAFVER